MLRSLLVSTEINKINKIMGLFLFVCSLLVFVSFSPFYDRWTFMSKLLVILND